LIETGNRRTFHDFDGGRSGDGMCIDRFGNVYIAGGITFSHSTVKGGIYVVNQYGILVEFMPIPEDVVTNCDIGGYNNDLLFVTAGKTLYRMKINFDRPSIPTSFPTIPDGISSSPVKKNEYLSAALVGVSAGIVLVVLWYRKKLAHKGYREIRKTTSSLAPT
jgi:hypothetical protein